MLFIWASPAVAEPVAADVQRWFDEEWARPVLRLEALGGRVVRWKDVNLSVPGPRELARLRAEVKGRPDHPERSALERFEETLAGRPMYWEKRLLCDGELMWRLCSDSPRGRYVDVAVSPGAAWQMTERELAILGDGPVVSVPGYSVEVDRQSAVTELGILLHAGLPRLAELAGVAAPRVEPRGERWSCRFRIKKTNTEVEIEGVWWAEAGRGVVERMVTQQRGKTGSRGWERRFSGWRPVPELGCWAAGVVEEMEIGRGPSRRREFLGCEAAGPKQVTAAVSIPMPGGEDPVRGRPTYAGYWDFRHGQERYFSVDAGSGAVVEVTNPSPSPGRLMTVVRNTGWSAGVLLLIGVAALKARRVLEARAASGPLAGR